MEGFLFLFMIIVNLVGGLGNQMFVYAAGRYLAEKNNAVLKLNISSFEDCKLRDYDLGSFNIIENIATKEEVALFDKKLKPRGFKKIIKKLSDPLNRHTNVIYKEKKEFVFDSGFKKLPSNVYLGGYFQNEKYFNSIENIIRKELVVKAPQLGKDLDLYNIIKDSSSVALHIRRGDYASNEKTKQVHGLLPIEYYLKSVELIKSKFSNPHFFVFSDDCQWATDNLRIDAQFTVVSHNDASKSFEDLRLMSQCKHQIIANSSFSWWGAWLNNYINKIVIAPKKWFQTTKHDTSDLLPKSWINF